MSLELVGRAGGPLGQRLVRELAALGLEACLLEAPLGRAPVVDLAIERSGDGVWPPGRLASPPDLAISSTLAYRPSERHVGEALEDWGPAPAGSPARAWRDFEAGHPTVLRAAPCPVPGGADFWSRWLERRFPPTVFGFDPVLQFLHPEDLAGAIAWALGPAPPGLYNVVPRRPIVARGAVSERGRIRLSLPSWLLRRWLGAEAEALRHPRTGGGQRAAAAGWQAKHSSRNTLRAFAGRAFAGREPGRPVDDDEHGLDPAYIRRLDRWLLRLLRRFYWRVEVRGLEHLPPQGPAIVVGVHRGFMPFDAVMMLLDGHRATGRWIRFLVHPGLLKMPFVAPFVRRLGGVIASREAAEWMLDRGRLLGVFPEGVRGAFTLYRDWARLGRFGSDEFLRQALRRQVPIVPFATVGSAEAFPILGRIRWRWWRRVAEWPFIPITTPFPLPSKWHTRVLPALDPADWGGPEAAEDPEVVAALREELRRRLQAEIDTMRSRRPSVFFGSVFDPE